MLFNLPFKHLILIMAILSCILVSCSSINQEQIQTAIAPVVSTALSGAGNYAQTQAVEVRETTIAFAETESNNFKKTAVAVVGTQAVALLTPEPPNIN